MLNRLKFITQMLHTKTIKSRKINIRLNLFELISLMYIIYRYI